MRQVPAGLALPAGSDRDINRGSGVPIRKRKNRSGYQVDVYRNQKRAQRTARTLAEAKELESRLYRELGDAPQRGLEEALVAHLTRSKPRDVSGLKSKAKAIRPYLVDRTIAQAPEAAAEMVRQWAHLSPATVNRRLALLRRLTYLAYELGWTDVQIGRRIKLLPENNEREIYLSAEQVEALANRMPQAGDAVRIAAYTGLTRSEVLRLSPADVRGDTIRVTRSKSNTYGAIPIAPTIAHIVPERLPLPINEYLLRTEFEAARKASGMKYVRFHDLRHTFGNFLAEKLRLSDREIQELMRLKSVQMVKRYAKLRESALREAMGKL